MWKRHKPERPVLALGRLAAMPHYQHISSWGAVRLLLPAAAHLRDLMLLPHGRRKS